MIKFEVPEKNDEILFKEVLQPSDVSSCYLIKGLDSNSYETALKLAFGRQNRVVVGKPFCQNLITRILEHGLEIPSDVKKMLMDFDFYFMSLSCSFLPDNRCKFTWARFEVELDAIDKKNGSILNNKPLVIDMFPDEVLNEVKFTKEISLKPNFKFDISSINAEIGKTTANKQEYIYYEAEMFAFGINSSKIAWDFNCTANKRILGNKRNMFMVVKVPKDSKLIAKFTLSVEVEMEGCLMKIPMITKKRKDIILDNNCEF